VNNSKVLTPEELTQRAIRFFDRYGKDLEQIKDLLEIRLKQLALAYTINQKLPPEAVTVSTRVKTLRSFLKKLERKGWPQFYYTSEVASDLIGARVCCWFLDDCYGFMKLINTSPHLKIDQEVEDYIQSPKPSGYRSVHLIANIAYDSVQREGGEVIIKPEEMKCEIQIRTKLQDAWGDITHEFHYKAKTAGVDDRDIESFLSDISERLGVEDKTLIKFRDVYQRMAEKKLANETREGFRDD
jgi:putative GTP pyrophosphokinase